MTILGFFVIYLVSCMNPSSNTLLSSEIAIVNPYESVDWENHKQYKGNLHTHTDFEEGKLSLQQVIDRYYRLGYSILSITDHNHVIDPWDQKIKDNDISNLLIVKGNEISTNEHDIGSYFNNTNTPNTNTKYTLEQIGDGNGLAVLFHPGRYKREIGWYKELLTIYPHLIGFEVINQGDRYPNDRKKWDKILSETMPQRPIWGFANDDMHKEKHIGRDWNVFIMPELTEAAFREAVVEGTFLFSSTSTVRMPRGLPPIIEKIEVDSTKGYIKLQTAKYNKVTWISNGRRVYFGHKININEVEADNYYVRAVITGPGGQTFTQPFGIIRKP